MRDLDRYLDLIERIQGAGTPADLEALVPELCAFAGGTYRQDLAAIWYRTWTFRFPQHPFNPDIWPEAP